MSSVTYSVASATVLVSGRIYSFGPVHSVVDKNESTLSFGGMLFSCIHLIVLTLISPSSLLQYVKSEIKT